MKPTPRFIISLLVFGHASLIFAQNAPPHTSLSIVNDRALATRRVTRENYLAVRDAVDRLAAAKDFGFLCEFLPNTSELTYEMVLLNLFDAPDDIDLVSVTLFNHLVRSNEPIGNSNGEEISSQVATAEKTINRLSRVLRVPSDEVDFHSTESVGLYIERIRPMMEKMRIGTQGAPPLAKPRLLLPSETPVKITTHTDVPKTPHRAEEQKNAPSNYLHLLAWLAVAASGSGLLLLFLKRRKT